jgi:hypothetical protein
VASKGLTGYGTWKSAQRIENKGLAKWLFAQESALRADFKNEGRKVGDTRQFLERVWNHLIAIEL